MNEAVLIDAVRSPMGRGKPGGALSGVHAVDLLAQTTAGLLAGTEVNEAFATVPLAWQAAFDTDPGRLNPRGGAIALGHPLGASGARLTTTVLGALEASGGRWGLQTMCEAGGMANAMLLERI